MTPSTENHFRGYWTRIMNHAAATKDVGLLEAAIEAVRREPGIDEDRLREHEQRLRNLRDEQS